MGVIEMNARELLINISDWLGNQNEALSDGFRCMEDAVKLYDYWVKQQLIPFNVPEFADEEIDELPKGSIRKHRIKALGYDPLEEN